MLESLRNKKILLIVAHPDDEILGLGGTMNRLIEEYNCTVKVVILGEGITSRSQFRDVKKYDSELSIHRDNIKQAQECIGFQDLSIYDFPDNRFDSIDLLDIVKIVEKEKEEFGSSVIFTHHGGDVNIDHQRTFEAVLTATRPMENELVKTIITFETASGTEWRASSDPKHFIPNFYVSISNKNLQSKIKAMESYKFEKREFPHPRSPEAMELYVKYRGVTVGKEMAEAFCIIRSIT